MNFVTSISLVVLGAMFLALLGWGSMRAAWRNCEGRRGVFAALAILAAICSIVAQKPSPDTPTITVDELLRDVGCYATNNVFHAAVTNAPSYAGVDFSDCDLMVYARERASTDAASWFELTPRKKFSQQPADYAIENATNYNYMVYLNYVPPPPVHTNGVLELYGFVIESEAQGEPDQLAAGFINSRAVPLPFDAEVEYLEGTGTQWIDTGVMSGASGLVIETRLYYDRYRSAYQSFFGARKDEASQCVRLILQASNNRMCYATPGGKSGASRGLSFAPAVWHDVRYDCDAMSATIDGATATQTDRGTAYSANMRLFGIGGSATSIAQQGTRIAYFRAWTNGNLVRDYIAVRKSGIGYMYDRASGQLFGNAGTGAFIVGPDK